MGHQTGTAVCLLPLIHFNEGGRRQTAQLVCQKSKVWKAVCCSPLLRLEREMVCGPVNYV